MKKGLIAAVAVVIVLVGAVVALRMKSSPSSGSGANQSQATATNQVNVQDMAFSPATIRVKKGSTVTWINKDATSHTVTSDQDGVLNSGTLAQGDFYKFTFSQTGTFAYHCKFHSGMHGTVIVTD